MRSPAPFLLVLLALLTTGCLGATWDHREVPAPQVAGADGTRWAQYCTFNGANDLAEINEWLRQLGEQGWELAAIGGNTGTVYCFKTRVAGVTRSPSPAPAP
jgi:hypothetical protein